MRSSHAADRLAGYVCVYVYVYVKGPRGLRGKGSHKSGGRLSAKRTLNLKNTL